MPKSAFSGFDSEDLPSIDISTLPPVEAKKVPNQFPSVQPSTYRIAIIGEAPGADEEAQLKPFVGMSGRFLDSILSSVGIVRACTFIGNVCQIRPPKNDISAFEFNGPEIQHGLKQLQDDLERFKPNLCILLGKTALYAAKGVKNLGDWRGSFFVGDRGAFNGIKCIASYHPEKCLKNYEWTPLLRFDIKRAAVEGRTKEWLPPQREFLINLTFEELKNELTKVSQAKLLISADIEGGVNSLSCIGVATSPTRAFIVPFERLDRTSVWSPDEEMELWRLISIIMADREVPKVWQNGLYDRFVLQYSYNILVRNSLDDTMLKWWELYCELEKSLGFQCSILTNEPYYKADRKTTDQETFYKYCCRDACVTYEINQKLTPLLDKEQTKHYSFNNEALNFLLYAELRGIRYDQETANSRLSEVQTTISGLQAKLDQIANSLGAIRSIDWTLPNETILKKVQEVCCYKKDQDRPKKGFEEDYDTIRSLLYSKETLKEVDRGLISVTLGLTMNIRSPMFKDFLYKTCGLPIQWKKDLKTKELRPTTDYEALLKLSKSHSHPALALTLDLSLLRTRSQMLAIKSCDGRMHCSYNLVGSETGRVTSSKSVIGGFGKNRVGANLQTVPDDWEAFPEDHPIRQGMRDLFLADEGCYLGKCDLKGSDGWTIGAYMAMLGDPTMLDDLKFGIKPAQVVAFIVRHGVDAYLPYANDREALREVLKEIKKEDWDYFCSKGLIWGFAYLLGVIKAAEMIFIQSLGKISLSKSQSQTVKDACFVRYRFTTWHNWMQKNLNGQSYPAKVTASNGLTRKFFGRNSQKNCEILGEALAHLPQVFTTYATLKAARNLWTDPENRTTDYEECPIGLIRRAFARAADSKFESLAELRSTHGQFLRVEPMHQVHDELLEQWKIQDTTWSIAKTKQWFNNPMLIANQQITIPFDGSYGTAWSMDNQHKKGEIK